MADAVLKDSGLWAFFKSDVSVEGQSRFANIEELLNGIKLFIGERNAEYAEDMIAEEKIMSQDDLNDGDYPMVTLSSYLENITLISAADVSDEETANRVGLMTVHTSKGLEFPYVYIAGMEENLFPSGGLLASESDVEEERRLFYVAVTRAKKEVSLSFATTRMRNGKSESNAPSRFITEIDRQYIANPIDTDDDSSDSGDGAGWSRGKSFWGRSGGSWGSQSRSYGGETSGGRRPRESYGSGGSSNEYGRSGKVYTEARKPDSPVPPRSSVSPTPFHKPVPPRASDADFVPTPIAELRAGQRIEHSRFGLGTIKSLTGNAPDLKAIIAFDDYGEKILLLRYAKIRKLE